MAASMSLSINPRWEGANEGSAEECATFAALDIAFGTLSLAEGQDPFIGAVRAAPYLSAYPFAEWLAWNWWRLRWEPRRASSHWRMSHCLSTIGEGYVWPNIEIFSDGERIALIAVPSRTSSENAYRYIADVAVVLPAHEFENEVDRLLLKVIGRLDERGVGDTNLHRLHRDLNAERQDGALSEIRRLEALLGFEPDEAPDELISQFSELKKRYGGVVVGELAAAADGAIFVSPADLADIAAKVGSPSQPRDRFQLRDWEQPDRPRVPAWVVGKNAAQAVRSELDLDLAPLEDVKLGELGAVNPRILEYGANETPFPFVFTERPNAGKVVLKSKWRANRRFELARLIGDHLMTMDDPPITVATRAATYTQKAQRAFAAELLCPYQGLEDFLRSDYSDESQEAAAEHFDVSPRAVQTVLVNHGRINHGDFVAEIDAERRIAA
jgi:hypothetical protein